MFEMKVLYLSILTVCMLAISGTEGRLCSAVCVRTPEEALCPTTRERINKGTDDMPCWTCCTPQ